MSGESQKTKKNKEKKNNTHLWNLFDNEINEKKIILIYGIYLIMKLMKKKWNVFIPTKKQLNVHVTYAKVVYLLPMRGFSLVQMLDVD